MTRERIKIFPTRYDNWEFGQEFRPNLRAARPVTTVEALARQLVRVQFRTRLVFVHLLVRRALGLATELETIVAQQRSGRWQYVEQHYPTTFVTPRD